jgi:hypothetical protein
MDIIQANTPLLAYSKSTRAIYSVSGANSSSAKTAKSEPITPPTEALEFDSNKSSLIAKWGDSDDFPAKIDKEIELNPVLSGAIQTKIEYLYAGGIEFGQEKIENGKKHWEYIENPEIDAFLTAETTQQYFAQSIFDYVRYGSIFPELVFSMDKSKVLICTGQETYHARWEKQNPSTGYIDYAYINRNWELGRNEGSEDTEKIPVIDPFVDTIDAIKLESNIYKYIFRARIPSSKTYYPLVNWWSAKTSGWLDVSNYIPRFKKSLMERQMSVQYHIEIDNRWLARKYEEKWAKSTAETKNEIFKAEIAHFNEMMSGPDKAGGNMMTTKFWDEEAQEWVSTITIHEIGKGNASGIYIEDSNEADAKIHYAVGIDMAMSNTKSGSGNSGSGSNKREAFNMNQSTNTIHASIILAPIYWAIRYNGLNPDNKIKLRMQAPYLQTLNQVTPSQRENTLPQ